MGTYFNTIGPALTDQYLNRYLLLMGRSLQNNHGE